MTEVLIKVKETTLSIVIVFKTIMLVIKDYLNNDVNRFHLAKVIVSLPGWSSCDTVVKGRLVFVQSFLTVNFIGYNYYITCFRITNFLRTDVNSR